MTLNGIIVVKGVVCTSKSVKRTTVVVKMFVYINRIILGKHHQCNVSSPLGTLHPMNKKYLCVYTHIHKYTRTQIIYKQQNLFYSVFSS